MIHRRVTGWCFGVLLVFGAPFLGCNLFPTAPETEAPADTEEPGDATEPDGSDEGNKNLAVFTDPDSDFSTSDVRDVDDEIVQFDPVAKTIIWAADGTAYQEGQWDVNGVLLAGGGFTVLFGTQDGERRAYFTLTADGFICQIEPQGASISISGTNVPVPQE